MYLIFAYNNIFNDEVIMQRIDPLFTFKDYKHKKFLLNFKHFWKF